MSNAVIPFASANVPANRFNDDKTFGELSSGGWLPRFQLYSVGTDEVKRANIPMNHYGFCPQKGTLTDLGEEVVIIPLTWRPKAMSTKGKPGVMSVYDPGSELFAQIKDKSFVKDSGCMFGHEFLIWIPAIKKFASLFFKSKSDRRIAPDLKAILDEKGAATLNSQLAENDDYSWQVMVITPSTVPIAADQLPDEQEYIAQMTKFANPPANEIEPVEADANRRAT